MSTKPTLIRASDRAQLEERTFRHPLNPESEIHGHALGDLVGLSRIGVHLVRVPPGKESFCYHRHLSEEEFVFVLSGRGIAEIDGAEHEVGPGDFMGFPAPSVAHHLRNPFDEDLVYVSGGERRPLEVAHFPRVGKTAIFAGGRVALFANDAAEAFGPFPKLG